MFLQEKKMPVGAIAQFLRDSFFVFYRWNGPDETKNRMPTPPHLTGIERAGLIILSHDERQVR